VARYLLLLHREDADFDCMTQSERDSLMSRFVAWTDSLKARGHLAAVERLTPDRGTTVRKKRDVVVVDGPYAEMRELVSGFYIVEAAGHDEANRIAGECPLVAVGGSIEVRAIDTFPVRP
jgi:hypothetical protein